MKKEILLLISLLFSLSSSSTITSTTQNYTISSTPWFFDNSTTMNSYLNCSSSYFTYIRSLNSTSPTYTVTTSIYAAVKISLTIYSVDLVNTGGNQINLYVNNLLQVGLSYSELSSNLLGNSCVRSNMSDYSARVEFYYPISNGATFQIKIVPIGASSTFGFGNISLMALRSTEIPGLAFVDFSSAGYRKWFTTSQGAVKTLCTPAGLIVDNTTNVYKYYEYYLSSLYPYLLITFKVEANIKVSTDTLDMYLNGQLGGALPGSVLLNLTKNSSNTTNSTNITCDSLTKGYNITISFDITSGLNRLMLSFGTKSPNNTYVIKDLVLSASTSLTPSSYLTLPRQDLTSSFSGFTSSSSSFGASTSYFSTTTRYLAIPKKGSVAKTFYMKSTTGGVLVQFDLVGFGVSNLTAGANVYIDGQFVALLNSSDFSTDNMTNSYTYVSIFYPVATGDAGITLTVTDTTSATTYRGLGMRKLSITAVPANYLSYTSHTGYKILGIPGTSPPSYYSTSSSTNVGVIVGPAVGVPVFIGIVVLICCCCKKKKKDDDDNSKDFAKANDNSQVVTHPQHDQSFMNHSQVQLNPNPNNNIIIMQQQPVYNSQQPYQQGNFGQPYQQQPYQQQPYQQSNQPFAPINQQPYQQSPYQQQPYQQSSQPFAPINQQAYEQQPFQPINQQPLQIATQQPFQAVEQQPFQPVNQQQPFQANNEQVGIQIQYQQQPFV